MKRYHVKSSALTALLLSLSLGLASAGCGGGGGDDVVEDEDFTGDVGTGANGVTIFWRYYPREEGLFGEAKAVLETPGGDFVLAGSRGTDFDFANRSTHLVKTDASGGVLLEKSFSPAGGSRAEAIVESGSGGYAAVGYAGSGSSRDLLLLATDGSLEQQWLKTEDRGGTAADEGHALLKLASGGYLVVGNESQEGKIWLFKTDAGGNKVSGSDRFYGYPGPNSGSDVIATSDGGYAISGSCVAEENGRRQACLVKTDSNGNQLWLKGYGTATYDGHLYSVAQTADGSYILAGMTDPFESGPGVDSELLVIKTDASGNEIWRRTFGGDRRDIGKKVLVMNDGNYLVVGTTQSYTSCEPTAPHNCQDIYLVKLDPEGNTLWHKVKGMDGSNEFAETAALTSDGGFVVAGSAWGRIMAAKFDATGATVTMGEKDFTYDVPATEGAVNGGNALSVAGASITALNLPRQVADFALERFTETLDGSAPSLFCDGSGTYGWSTAPVATPTAGSTFTLTFTDCVTGSGEDQVTYTGSADLTFNADATGLLNSDTHTLDVTVGNIALAFTDSVGTVSLGGATRFTRSAAGGTFSEHSQHAAAPLTLSEAGTTRSLQTYGIDDTVTGSSFSIGTNGDSSSFTISGDSTVYTAVVNEPIAGSSINAPLSGSFKTTAPDGSSLHLSVENGTAYITVDTDGNGFTDYTPQPQSWDELD